MMKKKLLAMALSATMVLGMAGCGAGNDGSALMQMHPQVLRHRLPQVQKQSRRIQQKNRLPCVWHGGGPRPDMILPHR